MIYDNDYYDLMALAEGYSAEDVDCFGGKYLLPMNEVVNLSGLKAYFGKGMKKANTLAKEANKLAKTDPDKAKKKYDEAINAYEDVKKDVRSKVRNDNIITWVFFKGWLDVAFQICSGESHEKFGDVLKSNTRDEVITAINMSIEGLKKKKAKL